VTERAVFLHDGQFANRPRAWLKIDFLNRSWKVEHDTALWIIYEAAMALWLTLLIGLVLECIRREYINFATLHPTMKLPILYVAEPTTIVVLIALIPAIRCVHLAGRAIRDKVEKAHQELTEAAARAYTRALHLNQLEALQDPQFIEQCGRLRGGDAERARVRGQFYLGLGAAEIKHYVPLDASAEVRAAHLVALLSDLPPRWVFECGAGKIGRLFEGHLQHGN
jgi:hypothetical protein